VPPGPAGHPPPPPPPAPGRSPTRVRRNLAGPPSAGARGLHCKVPSLSEGLSANQGHFCKDLKLLRGPVQKCNFNSICDLLNLVNPVENHGNIRKKQTQFCWFPREKYYNFCYTHLGCFLIFLA
jgi:hypothetical protein